MSLDVNWHNAEMECEGGPRPDGSGVRVAFAGPRHPDGRRLRLVFGVEALQEGHPAHDLPTNLTVIFEGEERLFATRGDDHCTVDELHQERVGALGGTQRAWRIVARGFCVAPASSLTGDARILVSSFDFAGVARFDDAERTTFDPQEPARTDALNHDPVQPRHGTVRNSRHQPRSCCACLPCRRSPRIFPCSCRAFRAPSCG